MLVPHLEYCSHFQAISESPLQCYCSCADDRCSKRLQTSCFILSIITYMATLFLAVQTMTVQQAGLAILLLVGSLVFLFLIFLQKKALKPGTALGCVFAGSFVSAFCLLILVVWLRDLSLLLAKDPVASQSSANNQTSMARVVEARLFPNPQPQLWGCFPIQQREKETPLKPDGLSTGCVVGQTLLGLVSCTCVLSSTGVMVVGAWVCIKAWKQRRQIEKTVSVCPVRLQRTISTPLTMGMAL